MKIQKINRYFIILVLLLLLDAAIGGFIGVWREWYWASISNKELYKWVLYIIEFSIMALVSCLVSGYSQYIANIASLKLRSNLTKKALKYKAHEGIEGGGQRVQEDCNKYPSLMIGLVSNFLRSILMILIFSIIIVINLPFYYLFIPFGYALIGTILASKIAKPLIVLNYLNQVIEAKFRQILTKLHYKEVHRNNFNLFKRTKYLNYFQSFYSQITIIFPHLVLASLYFKGVIIFGVFMQLAASMAEITNNLSVIINNLSDINNWLSCRKRLKEINLL